MLSKVLDEITYPFINFNGAIICISMLHDYAYVIVHVRFYTICVHVH